MTSMIEVQIVGLQLAGPTGVSVVLLGEPVEPTLVLPMLIGPCEAHSIAAAVSGVVPPRPGTHDLIVTLLERIDGRLEDVVVTELVEGTFYAELFVESATGLHRISARPSDGLALAVRTGAHVHVRAELFATAGVPVDRAPETPFDAEEIDEIVDAFQRFLADAQPSDFGDPEDGGDADADADPDGD